MKIRIRISKPEKFLNLNSLKSWLSNFRKNYPSRFYGTVSIILLVPLTIIFRTYFTDSILAGIVEVSEGISDGDINKIQKIPIEGQLTKNYNANVKGSFTRSQNNKIRTDVGFVDLRVLTLEDFFNHYGSPLADSSDEFIEACERYDIVNWQLLPAIGMAETIGCQTGFSYEQRNCWGWGGSEPNRWEFKTFAEAIDLISYRMIRGYGNNNMNAKDIQSTYCGRTCMQWGWRWAQGVDYYTKRINDFGEKYGLPRTNEIHDWS
jgi:hypothetical protein